MVRAQAKPALKCLKSSLRRSLMREIAPIARHIYRKHRRLPRRSLNLRQKRLLEEAAEEVSVPMHRIHEQEEEPVQSRAAVEEAPEPVAIRRTYAEIPQQGAGNCVRGRTRRARAHYQAPLAEEGQRRLVCASSRPHCSGSRSSLSSLRSLERELRTDTQPRHSKETRLYNISSELGIGKA